MKRLFPLLLLFIISCTPAQIAELEQLSKCPIITETPASVVGNMNNLFQGDILINQNKQAGATTQLWDNRIIPLVIDERWKSEPKKLAVIMDAITEFEALGYTFPIVTTKDFFSKDYPNIIYVKYSGVAASYIGKQGGVQDMYLPHNWNSLRSTTVHEFGHAVGLHHPHVTDKQGEWYIIYWDNIREENKDFFKMYTEYGDNYTGQKEGSEYGDQPDCCSVMAYSWNAFAIDPSKPTMTMKDGTKFTPGDVLTDLDKLSINRMQDCYDNYRSL